MGLSEFPVAFAMGLNLVASYWNVVAFVMGKPSCRGFTRCGMQGRLHIATVG